MAITPDQQLIIVQAHGEGHLDPAIAHLAGVSIATVKRYRTKLGLETNCVTAKRGKLGEQLTFDEAERRGLKAEWRVKHNGEFDLYVSDQRVDAKASMQLADGSWRFRLPETRAQLLRPVQVRQGLRGGLRRGLAGGPVPGRPDPGLLPAEQRGPAEGHPHPARRRLRRVPGRLDPARS